jgi:broad specificity phosphatase PhoE
MTRLIFIRHAATDCFQDRLAGRNADVHLSAAGKIQGQRLAPGPAEPSEELREIEQWREFNLVRSCAHIPNGELMVEVQARVLALIERLCGRHSSLTLALVSHADVIRVALTYCLGMPLDLLLRLEVRPASIVIVAIKRYGPRVLCINNMGELGDQTFC